MYVNVCACFVCLYMRYTSIYTLYRLMSAVCVDMCEMLLSMYMHVSVCVYASMCVRVCACMRVCVHVSYVCMFASVCVCVCVCARTRACACVRSQILQYICMVRVVHGQLS